MRQKMCVNNKVNTMVPAVVNLVTTKGKDTYSGIISEFACFKCGGFSSTNEKDSVVDTAELWKTRHPKTVSPALASANDLVATTITASTITSTTPPPISTSTTTTTTAATPTPHSAFRRWRKSATSLKLNTENNKQNLISGTDEDMSLLKFLAINALDLSAPASDVLLKSRSSNWFQLSGHPDSLAPAGPGTVWKKRSPNSDDTEREVYEELSVDPNLAPIIPRYYREVEYQGERFIELQDLLHGFQDPYVIDIKMGTRTFLESEVMKGAPPRTDLYHKMCAIDPYAPTHDEHLTKAVTKLRYMQFREQQSSSCSHGFRIEAMKCRGAPPVTDLKRVKCAGEVRRTLRQFMSGRGGGGTARRQEGNVGRLLHAKLCDIRTRIERSEFFKTHEVVGSSLFVIYDDNKVGVWLIDFAKTNRLPDGLRVNHRRPWVQGNHEEGLLFGLDRLISVIESITNDDAKTNEQFAKPLVSVES